MYLYDKMDGSCTYCGNPFTKYVTQTSKPCALKLNSVVCQSFLNKTGGEITALLIWRKKKKQEQNVLNIRLTRILLRVLLETMANSHSSYLKAASVQAAGKDINDV